MNARVLKANNYCDRWSGDLLDSCLGRVYLFTSWTAQQLANDPADQQESNSGFADRNASAGNRQYFSSNQIGHSYAERTNEVFAMIYHLWRGRLLIQRDAWIRIELDQDKKLKNIKVETVATGP